MKNKSVFPEYIQREDSQRVIDECIQAVQGDGQSRVFLLYGKGGSGKSVLLNNLPKQLSKLDVIWAPPIDLDDIQFWSLDEIIEYLVTFLESQEEVAQLTFSTYRELLKDKGKNYTKLQDVIGDIKPEDDKRQLHKAFYDGYRKFVEREQKTAVIRLDTVETVRELDVISFILQWATKMPRTLFIFAGRPAKGMDDRVLEEIERNFSNSVIKQELGDFSSKESDYYLSESAVFGKLEESQIEKIKVLTQHHPLWLALTVYYFQEIGVPDIVLDDKKYPLSKITELPKNSAVFDRYVSTLLTPYKEDSFWHEAIFRLGIIRQRVNSTVWKKIMEDVPLPKETGGWKQAWGFFKELPWVRERANKRYITLQDAFAEELAKRYIPSRDENGKTRLLLWEKAAEIYAFQIEQKTAFYENISDNLSKQELNLSLLQVVGMHYKILSEHKAGVNLFQQLSLNASRRLAELLVSEGLQFLPDIDASSLEDVENKRIKEIRNKLRQDKKTFFTLYHALLELLLQTERYDKIKELADKASKYLEKEPKYQVEIFVWLFTGTWRNDLPGAIAYLYKAIEIIDKEKKLQKKLAEIQYLIGFAYRAQHQLHRAKEWLEKAAKTSRKQRQPEILAKTFTLLGYIYRVLDNESKATPTVQEAVVLQQQILNRLSEDDPKYRETKIYLAWSYNTLGEISRYRGKLAVAQSYYEKAQQLFSETQYYEGEAIAFQALSDTRRRIALAVQRRGDIKKSERYWKKTEDSILESLQLYEIHNLDRELETAYRRYGRFLHARGSSTEAESVFKKGLEEAERKNNFWEMIENAQELAFLAGEQGSIEKFLRWEQKIIELLNQRSQESEHKVEHWTVFIPLLEIARGCLYFSQGKYEASLNAYLKGYTELASIDGYGLALYEAHRDRLFKNIQKITSVEIKKEWLKRIIQEWGEKGLKDKLPGLVDLCEMRLVTIDLFLETGDE